MCAVGVLGGGGGGGDCYTILISDTVMWFHLYLYGGGWGLA